MRSSGRSPTSRTFPSRAPNSSRPGTSSCASPRSHWSPGWSGSFAPSSPLPRCIAAADNLTGLANRGWFLENLVREVERAQRYVHPLTIGYIDIDDFKAVNDTYGHQAGDRLLQRIARTLQEHVRDVDLAGRLGGDEFMLLLPETGPENARATIERLSEALRSATRDEGYPVTFSVGVLTFASPPDDPSAAIVQADELMYEVKRKGKDGFLHRVIE
ncbi:MAG: GGDEF domain-containing protein [Trueperaceae bacterium]|nr:GGDEF domain-containing protein [Trueperaceae bacterium]